MPSVTPPQVPIDIGRGPAGRCVSHGPASPRCPTWAERTNVPQLTDEACPIFPCFLRQIVPRLVRLSRFAYRQLRRVFTSGAFPRPVRRAAKPARLSRFCCSVAPLEELHRAPPLDQL